VIKTDDHGQTQWSHTLGGAEGHYDIARAVKATAGGGGFVTSDPYYRPACTWLARLDVSGEALPSGLYFVRLQSGTFSRTQKLLLLK
jgi:hypothetical protein